MRRWLFLAAIGLQVAGLWLALQAGAIAGPAAHPESLVRNILYAHVPSSICALLCFIVLLGASIGYLRSGRSGYDYVAAAAGEAAFIFATVLNATGMLFSRAEWNIWWTPSPRLVSSAVLWFLAVVYLILRVSFEDSPRQRARVCAVFGIIAFIDVPMVLITARFLPDIHRRSFTLDAPVQSAALMVLMLASVLLAAGLIWLRSEVLSNQAKLQQQNLP